MGQHRIRNLDAMRGICALTVVLFHCDGMFATGRIFEHGYLAVDLFFILSGFVLGHTYEERLAKGLTPGSFMRLRLNRLAPVYWAGTLLCIASFLAVALLKPAGVLSATWQTSLLGLMALMLAPVLGSAESAYPVNPVAWSLLGELIANFMYARWLYAKSTRFLVGLTLAGWGVCILYACFSAYGWDFGSRGSDIAALPLRAVPAFLAGVVLFRFHAAGHLARMPAVSPLIPVAAWAVIAACPRSGPAPLYDALVVIVASSLLIALAVRTPATAPRFFLWLGAISYPLYASHLAIVFPARHIAFLGFNDRPNIVEAFLVLCTALAVAQAIHYFVERRNVLKLPLMKPV